MKPSVPYHELLIEKLKDPKAVRAYLEVAIEEFEAYGDKEHFLLALRNVIEAQMDENVDYSDIPETDDTFWEKPRSFIRSPTGITVFTGTPMSRAEAWDFMKLITRTENSPDTQHAQLSREKRSMS
jgi:hypothetical protein